MNNIFVQKAVQAEPVPDQNTADHTNTETSEADEVPESNPEYPADPGTPVLFPTVEQEPETGNQIYLQFFLHFCSVIYW